MQKMAQATVQRQQNGNGKVIPMNTTQVPEPSSPLEKGKRLGRQVTEVELLAIKLFKARQTIIEQAKKIVDLEARLSAIENDKFLVETGLTLGMQVHTAKDGNTYVVDDAGALKKPEPTVEDSLTDQDLADLEAAAAADSQTAEETAAETPNS
jgi:hypothetical protein